MPTQTVNLNGTLPAAPAGAKNVQWQADAPSLDPSVVRNVSASLPAFTGDAGAGGAMGLVPAPAAGDAAAGKHLKADGTWAVPVIPASDVTGLATVATSGSYADLSNNPAIPAAQVNSDWNSGAGVSQILNKPALAASATTDTTNASNITSGTLAAARVATLNQDTTGTAATITGNITEAQVTGLVADLAAKAPLASPTFSGVVTAPTYTAASGTDVTIQGAAAGGNALRIRNADNTSNVFSVTDGGNASVGNNLSVAGNLSVYGSATFTARGILIPDTTNGHVYKLTMVNGVLTTTLVS